MDTSEIKKDLWNSLDMAVLRRDMILVCLIVGLYLAIMGVFGGFGEPEFPVLAVFICIITILPVAIYSICVAVKLFRHADRYVLYRCRLSQPHHCKWGRGAMYFTVLLEDAEGRFIADTRPIFASWGITGPLLEDYINQTVTVAYNEETEAIVVLG